MATVARHLTPSCPGSVTEEAHDIWQQIWESTLSDALADSDVPVLRRWLWWYDQWLITSSLVDRLGSALLGVTGDRILKAKMRYLSDCESNLQRLEEALGLTPMARMRLGIRGTKRIAIMPKKTTEHRRKTDYRRLLVADVRSTAP